MKEIVLTGIKPTGMPHIGNYMGAIKPAIELSKKGNADFYFFIADYHALNNIASATELKNNTYEIACTWLACGLDPNNVFFYRQSDVPETFELSSVLTNVTPKGLMNRAHAYKAMIDKNKTNGLDEDANVNMGLFNYPILMAADIMLFNSNLVPVGLDQKQHVEIARDIAGYFNKKYGNTFVLPKPLIGKEVATVIGLDGRKMSKSYNNTIKLFCSEEELRKTINKIVTDSTPAEEPKGTDNTIYDLYKLFATKTKLLEFENKLKSGISWGEAKKELFELINIELSPMRETYNFYKNNLHLVDKILKIGAKQAREVAKETMTNVRIAIGVEND